LFQRAGNPFLEGICLEGSFSVRKSKRAALLSAVVAATSLVVTQQSHAAVTWDGGATPDTTWSNASNWVGDAAPPTGTSETITFDATGIANLANTVDAALPGTTFQQLNYRVNDTTATYITSIDKSLTLNLGNSAVYNAGTQTALFTNSSFVVVPANAVNTTTPVQTGTNVIIQSTGSGAQGGLSITSGNFLVSGRPGTATTADSYAILDMRNLASFTFTQPTSPLINGVFSIGQGTSGATGIGEGGTDNNAYWGRVILGPKSTININRLIVGGQNNAGTSGQQPVSQLLLAGDTVLNTSVAGNMQIGYDPALGKDSSGAMLFRSDLTDENPSVTIGNNTHRNGLVIGSNRFAGSTGHRAYGVIDGTTASGKGDGAINAFFAGFMTIGRASGGAGGSAGMLSIDKGDINANSYLFLASTNNNANTQSIHGILNVSGTVTFKTIRDSATGTDDPTDLPYIAVGRRSNATSGENIGIINLSGSGEIEAERVFIAYNSQSGTGRSTGIVNLNGGVLTAYQIQAGADADVGSTNTRLLNFNGGTLRAKTGTTFGATFLHDQLSTAGGIQAYVYSGGGTFDTNGENVTVEQALLAPTGNGLTSYTITNGGSGYRAAPIVNLTGGGGVGATAVAQINSAGVVTGITITNAGTGYASAPNFELIANGGTNYANTLVPYGGAPATIAGTISGNISGGITKISDGTLTLNGANTYTGATTVNQGTLVLGQSSLFSNAMNATGGDIKLAAGGKVIDTGAVSAATGKVDLTDGKLIVRNAVANEATLTGYVTTGRNGGTWDGTTGITSSSAAVNPGDLLYAVGIGTAADARGLTGGATASFGGQIVTENDVLARYTYLGDATLDGVINGDDYLAIDAGFSGNAGGGKFVKGDFDYSGTVDADDYWLIDRNYSRNLTALSAGAPVLGGVGAVPEPASVSLLAIGAAGLLGRRRRARRAS
jgi:autotransporter-associated beta strand protein